MKTLVAVAVALTLLFAGAASAEDLDLQVVSQTATTITFRYGPVVGAEGYRYYTGAYVQGAPVFTPVARTFDPAKLTVKFAKGPEAFRVTTQDVSERDDGYSYLARAQCNNTLDDDGDGKIDYPADPGCSRRNDNSEIDVTVPPPDPPPTTGSAPPAAGYFPATVAAGNTTSLPSGTTCASQVHRSTWEPRPWNTKRNNIVPNAAAVHAAFAARPFAEEGTIAPQWDTWLLPRVDGQFTGTTDEIFQWAACKWGVPDNVIRAAAYQESTWYQYLTYPSGRCVSTYGCGDFFGSTSAASKVFCDYIDTFGHAYQPDYAVGQCPQTFSILGIKSWWAPEWGYNFASNQNGTFPFNRNSTAFAADYYGSQLRGCLEGWIEWLGNPPNDLWGCVGHWFSGGWHDAEANRYASEVQAHLNNHVWLGSNFQNDRPGCSSQYGCPGPDTLP